MSKIPPIVLSIAGFDPSSGAGVTADIKTIAAHGCYGMACITALTVQSTAGVRQVVPVPGALVRDTLEELAADVEVSAIRIGMLGSAEVAREVVDFLQHRGSETVVLDPILRASSETALLNEAGVEVLKDYLLRLATVVTPNLHEAEVFTGIPVENLAGMRAAAGRLHQLGAKAVVLTGGHLEGAEAVDLLSISGAEPCVEEFRGKRLASRSTHGTGCAFATALACNLAKKQPLRVAVAAAKDYVARAIARAYPLGHGMGPVNHFAIG
ncbi:MAG: bifunctional hydroxymethylpyrimidine kinase/phosphomethylpyrimidine kinase [Terriglobales bacterium]